MRTGLPTIFCLSGAIESMDSFPRERSEITVRDVPTWMNLVYRVYRIVGPNIISYVTCQAWLSANFFRGIMNI